MEAPAIIIGLGGIGSDICTRVAALMPQNAPGKENVRFVIMDTDINTIRDMRRKKFRGTEILLSDNITVEKCQEMLKKETKDWYPNVQIFNEKSMTEGAGQQRAISRLALEYAAAAGKLVPLYDLVRELNELDPRDSKQQIRFYIISSLAGGTGSGIILPLAMYLNQFVLKELGDPISLCKGFFMLSSALEKSIDTALEQKSLDANAYAAIKELSYFMEITDMDMTAYSDIHVPLPGWDVIRRESQKDENHLLHIPKTYEYCYLFGMANENGKRLNSFESLKDLIADAVYMQACSPIHDRNSAREDNKLRHGLMQMQKLQESKLRRFGGIGCGRLIYPYENLKELFALCWQKNVMEGAWQKYDKAYYSKYAEYRELKRQRKKAEPVVRSQEYISGILTADRSDLLAEDIRLSCCDDEGNANWENYLDALKAKVDQTVKDDQTANTKFEAQDEELFVRHLDDLGSSSYSGDKKVQVINEMISLFPRIKQRVMGIPELYGHSLKELLFTMHFMSDDLEPYMLEYWLRREEDFIHPNAIRYFLYNLKKAIQLRQKSIETKLDESESRIDWVDNYTEQKVKRRSKDYFVKIKSDFQRSYMALYNWAECQLYKELLISCEEYTDSLTANYESFYDSYGEMLMETDGEISLIAEKLDQTKGATHAYVCADRECREAMMREIKKCSGYYQVTSELSWKIYQLMQEPVKSHKQLAYLFDEIRQYWLQGTENTFDHILNMNILHAMDMEEYYKNGIHINNTSLIQGITRIRDILVAPFVQYMKTTYTNQGISIICYNSILKHEQGEFRKVVKWLDGLESVDDAYYCSPYELIFYRSFVGLDSYEVLEYLHGFPSSLAPVGKAFVSYEEVIEDRGRVPDDKQRITPHIDQEWHNLRKIPDPKKNYKELQITQAFVYAYVSGMIKRTEENHQFNSQKTWGFKVLDEEKTFDSLVDCYEELFENQFWVKELLRILHDTIKAEEDKGTNPLERLKTKNNSLFYVFFEYNKEAGQKRWDNKTNRLFIRSIENLITLFMGGDKEKAMECIREEAQKLCEKCENLPQSLTGERVKEVLESRYFWQDDWE